MCGRILAQRVRTLWVAAASGRLPMVLPFAIGKAFGLAAATLFGCCFLQCV